MLLARFAGRRKDTREFALRNRVLLLESSDGIGIDVALGAMEFEERVMRRASDFNFLDDCRLRTCSAEDFIVMKAFANRDQDWLDLETVFIRQEKKLNWRQILAELRPLVELKESPEIIPHIERVRRKIKTMK